MHAYFLIILTRGRLHRSAGSEVAAYHSGEYDEPFHHCRPKSALAVTHVKSLVLFRIKSRKPVLKQW